MDYKEEYHYSFLEKILDCKNLLNIMHQKNIYIPSHIQNILFVQKKEKISWNR